MLHIDPSKVLLFIPQKRFLDSLFALNRQWVREASGKLRKIFCCTLDSGCLQPWVRRRNAVKWLQKYGGGSLFRCESLTSNLSSRLFSSIIGSLAMIARSISRRKRKARCFTFSALVTLVFRHQFLLRSYTLCARLQILRELWSRRTRTSPNNMLLTLLIAYIVYFK